MQIFLYCAFGEVAGNVFHDYSRNSEEQDRKKNEAQPRGTDYSISI